MDFFKKILTSLKSLTKIAKRYKFQSEKLFLFSCNLFANRELLVLSGKIEEPHNELKV